jgi:hypothetical protein
MTKAIQATLRNISLDGEVTDMDAFLFAGFLMPDFDSAVEQEKGLFLSFQKFSAEHAALMAIAGIDQQKALASDLAQEWGERLMIRISLNLRLRAVFTQRLREVYPLLSKQWVDCQRWLDTDNNQHEESKLRLDLTEVMVLINPIIGSLQDSSPLATPPAVPVALTAPEDEVTRLRRELAVAQNQLAVSGTSTSGQGFAKESRS